MKELHQQHAHHKSKAWTSLDCLLTRFPIAPLSRSLLIMRSNVVLQMTDIRHLSPQTTSSSGYHSDLSSTNESPQSIHDNLPTIIEQSTSSQIQKKIIDNKLLTNKNLLRISNFIRKQYERAKSKLIPQKQLSPPITTCSKATSTTPLSYLSENNHIKPKQFLSSVCKQSSFIEPVYSVYVHPLYDNQIKIPSKNDPSIPKYYSHQPSSHPLISYSKSNNNQVNSHSYRRSAAKANYENITTGCLSNNHNTRRRHHYCSIKPSFCQNYYAYKYINKNYDCNRLTYAPLSDFISTTNSAFKPIKFYQRPLCHLSEQIPPSDDPCDLEVAQYFHQTPQWSNPNYYDIYKKEIPTVLPRKNYTETLC